MGEEVSAGERMYVTLDGMPASYDSFRLALELKEDLTLEQIGTAVRDYEETRAARRRSHGEEELHNMQAASLAVARTRGAGGARAEVRASDADHRCRLCDGMGHFESRCTRRKGTGSACFRCGSEQHAMRDCREDQGASAHYARRQDDDNVAW